MFNLTPRQEAWIVAEAARLDVRAPELIRRILDEHLDRHSQRHSAPADTSQRPVPAGDGREGPGITQFCYNCDFFDSGDDEECAKCRSGRVGLPSWKPIP